VSALSVGRSSLPRNIPTSNFQDVFFYKFSHFFLQCADIHISVDGTSIGTFSSTSEREHGLKIESLASSP
jgi:hypothetical protein